MERYRHSERSSEPLVNESKKSPNFPVKFPVIREIDVESGSLETPTNAMVLGLSAAQVRAPSFSAIESIESIT
jgi:hypothetical protein